MKKINFKKGFAVSAASALSLVMLAGCGKASSRETTSMAASREAVLSKKIAGTILLSVNPEIEIDYDKRGLVVEVEGVNDDGKKILLGLKEYAGKDTRTVINELVAKIHEEGYFDQTLQGHSKNIVLKMQDGSLYPGDDFLENIAREVREAAISRGIASHALTVQRTDLDDKGLIGREKAKELILSQLGLSEASFRPTEYELDDGVYEFEFFSGGIKYQYEVDARTGKILEADLEGNDDWDDILVGGDSDDWYDDDRYDDGPYDDDWYEDRSVSHGAPTDRSRVHYPNDIDDDRYDDDRYDNDRYDDDRDGDHDD